MADERLAENLQDALLAVLAFDDRFGSLVAAQVLPEHFDGVYHEVASAVLTYRKKYGRPPGKTHIQDLFVGRKTRNGDERLIEKVLVELAALSEGLNAEYIASRALDHVREQKLKAALLEANERYTQGGENTVSDVEGILGSALRLRQHTLDAGTRLSEVFKSSVFTPRDELLCPMNIPEFDRWGIGPVAKRMFLYIAPKNTGKSWAGVHVGRQGLLNKQHVLHIVNEMEEPELLDRYYMSFFAMATKAEPYARSMLEFDELERLTGFKTRQLKPRLSFSDPKMKKYLIQKVKDWGTRFDRLIIKAFPSGQLTMSMLYGYLDYLEVAHKFFPTLLIVDYPDLFKLGSRGEHRHELGRVFVDLRGLASERNMALFTPTQSGRDTIGASRVRSTNVTEDISKVFTADTVVTYSQTEAESQRGLARLTVEHARHAPKGIQVLITQSYATGQFVLQSARLTNNYFSKLKEVSGEDAVYDED